jgi:hypothetical protein
MLSFATVGRVLRIDKGTVRMNWQLFIKQGNSNRTRSSQQTLTPMEHDRLPDLQNHFRSIGHSNVPRYVSSADSVTQTSNKRSEMLTVGSLTAQELERLDKECQNAEDTDHKVCTNVPINRGFQPRGPAQRLILTHFLRLSTPKSSSARQSSKALKNHRQSALNCLFGHF